MTTPDFSTIALRLKKEAGKTYVFDPLRKKWLILTPEEHIRQLLIGYLTEILNYPSALISVEKKIALGKRFKRFDIVVYDRKHCPWMLIECKEPDVSITEATLQQLLNYQNVVQARYWVLANGHQLLCADAADIKNIEWLISLPAYEL